MVTRSDPKADTDLKELWNTVLWCPLQSATTPIWSQCILTTVIILKKTSFFGVFYSCFPSRFGNTLTVKVLCMRTEILLVEGENTGKYWRMGEIIKFLCQQENS